MAVLGKRVWFNLERVFCVYKGLCCLYVNVFATYCTHSIYTLFQGEIWLTRTVELFSHFAAALKYSDRRQQK